MQNAKYKTCVFEIVRELAQTRHCHQRNTSHNPCQQIVFSANFYAACVVRNTAKVV